MENQSNSLFQKFNEWVKSSIMLKLIAIAILMLLLLIPTGMIQELINERSYLRDSVINEISSNWGNRQTVTGPVLTVPYHVISQMSEGGDKYKEYIVTEYAHFLPDDLNIDGAIKPEIRYRGIYKVPVYNTLLSIKGNFQAPDFSHFSIDPNLVQWKDAFITIGIPDMRGIQDNIEFNWNGKNYPVVPGVIVSDVISSGVSLRIPMNPDSMGKEAINFSFEMDLNGSKGLHFAPLGKETIVNLQSEWSNPSFSGAFLPDVREVTEDGFTANWKVLHLNRNFPQQWKGKKHSVSSSEFGVNLLFAVDEYQKSMRSAKYAIMFISLTFLIFFFVEVLNKKRIHPIQYLLVGIALCLFYSLLLSLSEWFSFDMAYLVASIGIILMITFYCKSIFKEWKLTLVVFGVLCGLYGFLFTILQRQDYSLMLGSIGLFIILAIVMFLSRKVNWYATKIED